MLDTVDNCTLLVYVDSAVTIRGVELLMGDQVTNKERSCIANYSVLETIANVAKDKQARGFQLRLEKVESHTGANDARSLLNARADVLAEAGRTGDVLLNDPLHNCFGSVLIVGGEVFEHRLYNVAYRRFDAAALERARSLANASERLDQLDMHGVWMAASKVLMSTLTGQSLLAFKLFFRCLPTPRIIQLTNPHLPGLYDGGMCPLCSLSVGDEYHLFCRCGKLRGVRDDAYSRMEAKIRKDTARFDTGALMVELKVMLTPMMRYNFKFGSVPMLAKEALQRWMGKTDGEMAMMTTKIRGWVHGLYYDIWEGYGEMLEKTKMDFSHRLKAVCGGISVERLRLDHNLIKEIGLEQYVAQQTRVGVG